MAEEKEKIEIKLVDNPLIGVLAQPTTLNNTTKLDIDITNKLADDIIAAGMTSKLDTNEIENFTNISNNREQIYNLIDTMMHDSTVSAVVRTMTADVCEMAENGHVIWAESSDPKISKYVNYLLNTVNADKNIYNWAYSLILYGDVYLRLYRESDYKDDLFSELDVAKVASSKNRLNEEFSDQGSDKETLDENINLNISKMRDHYSYYVELVPNPANMFELTKFGKTYGYIETPDNELNNVTNYLDLTIGAQGELNGNLANYHMKSNDVNIYLATDFVHGYLENGVQRFPETVDLFLTDDDYNTRTNAKAYTVKRGKSMLIDAYKIWREKALIEAAILLTRVTRSSLIQKVLVEVGDMSKEKTRQVLREVKQLFEQKTAINPASGSAANGSLLEYTNPGAIVNTVYLATHGGQGNVTVEAIGGDINIKDLADLDNWTSRFFAAFGIPKQYFGATNDETGFNGGTSLTIQSSVYARLVKRILGAIVLLTTDMINLFLLDKGYKSYLNNFSIKMKAPLTQEEKDNLDSATARVSAVSNTISLFTDIEDKSRRLQLLKELISNLNYGDSVTLIITDEIKAVEKAAEEAATSAEQEELAAGAETGPAGTTTEAAPGNEDLGVAGIAAESMNIDNEDLILLTEDIPDLLLLEDDTLPSPEEANENIDFTKNN